MFQQQTETVRVWKENSSFLNEPVPNEKLENIQTGEQELIISDSTRYTLIIFSASWCNPCHKQLPIQKQIYEKLKDKLNMVTVSLDKKEGIDNWKSFVEQKAIPWRTLICKDIKYVQEQYKVPNIPHCKLVYPNLKDIEAFDLWNENDVNRLYDYFYAE